MSKPLDLLTEFDSDGYPLAGVYRPNTSTLVVIPPTFWAGEWSAVALTVFFRLLVDEYGGQALEHLCHDHPNIPRDEIANALDALERYGFITATMVQTGIPGYTIADAHIRGVEHISCYEDEDEDEEGGSE